MEMFKTRNGWCVYTGDMFKYFRYRRDAIAFIESKTSNVLLFKPR